VVDWFVYKNDIPMKWSPISILNGLSVEQCCAVASRPNHQSALMFVAGTVLLLCQLSMILPYVVYMYLTSFKQTKTLPSCVPAGAELVDCFSCMYFVLFYYLMLLILCAVLAVKLLFSDCIKWIMCKLCIQNGPKTTFLICNWCH